MKKIVFSKQVLSKVMSQLTFCFLTCLPLTAAAQDVVRPIRGNCTPGIAADASADGTADARAAAPRRLPSINRDMWDILPEKHSIVVLVQFSDVTFSMDDPVGYYTRLFNESGYNEGRGAGCVADYFRAQSDGRCDITFDVYGPVTVDQTAKNSSDKYRTSLFRAALLAQIAAEPADSKMGEGCDWDGDGKAQQVVFVFAGLGANVDNIGKEKGCIWPHTTTFSAVTLPNGLKVSDYTVSAELLTPSRLCGIGTICHEFSHSLGLPDIYPTSSDATEFSVVDEWDLMDGGNFTNNGWCPPNYTVLEKYLMGWGTPVELDTAVTITNMASVADGGDVYLVRHTDNEFFLLENRQWKDWDLRLPGHGLLITHVDYDATEWRTNRVNNNPSHHRYDVVHADGWDYTTWRGYIDDNPDTYKDGNPYVGGHNQIMSLSPYPYTVDGVVMNDALTDESVPAATVYSGDSGLLGQPITEIEESADGLISFKFKGGSISSDIEGIQQLQADGQQLSGAFDLQGRRVSTAYPQKGVYIVNGRKVVYSTSTTPRLHNSSN